MSYSNLYITIKTYNGVSTLAELEFLDYSDKETTIRLDSRGIWVPNETDGYQLAFDYDKFANGLANKPIKFLGVKDDLDDIRYTVRADLSPYNEITLRMYYPANEKENYVTWYVFGGHDIVGRLDLDKELSTTVSLPPGLWGDPQTGHYVTQDIHGWSGGLRFLGMRWIWSDFDHDYQLLLITEQGGHLLCCTISATGELTWVSPDFKTLWFHDKSQIINDALFYWLFDLFKNNTTSYAVGITSPDGSESETISTYLKGLTSGSTHVTIKVTESGVEMIEGGPNSSPITLYSHSSTKEFLGISVEEYEEMHEYKIGEQIIYNDDDDGWLTLEGYISIHIKVGEDYAYYMVKAKTLRDIADAIRQKSGKNEEIKVKDFASEISNLIVGTS